MPIVSTDIDYKYSGGAANNDASLSIGGAISSNDVSASLHGLFDIVGSDEASAGDVEYRCFYVQNNHGTITAQNCKIWIESQTTSADTDIAIGIGAAAVDATETATADESTAPAGVTFSSPADKAGGLTIPNLAAGSYQAVWVRRTVNAAAAAVDGDAATIRVSVDTSE
jgi:hypothetical protein